MLVLQAYVVGMLAIIVALLTLSFTSGRRLVFLALLYVAGMWGFTTLLAFVVPHSSASQNAITGLLILAIYVGLDDFIRTRFVYASVMRNYTKVPSALTYASIAAIVEMMMQGGELLLSAAQTISKNQGLAPSELASDSLLSISDVFYYLSFDILRFAVHFLLSICLYECWKLRRFITLALVVVTHCQLDFLLGFALDSNHESYGRNIAIIMLFYSISLGFIWYLIEKNYQHYKSSAQRHR